MNAPGAPGISARWTSSDKSGVGCALSARSRVWFTLSHGILNECYYPRVDQACIRDCGLIVTDGRDFFAEEKRDTESRIHALADGVPAYHLVNTHRPEAGSKPRFRIIKRVIADPNREVVLQSVRLEPLDGGTYRLFVLLAPHLVNRGASNTGWVGTYKGETMLFARGRSLSLALATQHGFGAASAGFAGVSDGWQDLSRHFEMRWRYDRAEGGNVALTGELVLDGAGETILALGFGSGASEAAFRVRSSLQAEFATLLRDYAQGWQDWQRHLRPLDRTVAQHNTYRVSTAVLRAHEAPSFPGGFIASLSIPWGAIRGDDDLGGYHLVWPRDLVQTAGGLLAAGAHEEAVRVLDYLRAIQEPDGHWPQNSWLDGQPYWNGVQMDECAFPILLADLAFREGALGEAALARFLPMVRAAAGFLLRNGPTTGQDRWEENSGFNTYTLAVEIAALLAAADLLERHGEAAAPGFLRDTADSWNARIEDWVFAEHSPLAQQAGVAGHYLRFAPDQLPAATADKSGTVLIKNHCDGDATHPAGAIASADALALVRFGLRDAADPRIVATVAVIDEATRVELPAGPGWYRYSFDGYGEMPDGSGFQGCGHGRLWPLLTGERAHYALAAGDRDEAERLLATMEACASRGALLPEQVWDTDDIPARELYRGKPSGSAMPLVWAHAEHVKLLRSLAEERVFDMPPQTARRYLQDKVRPRVLSWRENFRALALPSGLTLRVELTKPAIVVWTGDDWTSTRETETADTGFGLHAAELTPPPGATALEFTWRTPEGTWHGANVRLPIH